MYGAAFYDAVYRFGFLLQITFLMFVDSPSAGLFFVINASLVVGKSFSNLGFSRARYQHLILASEEVMRQSLKVLVCRQGFLLLPLFLIVLILAYWSQSALLLAGLVGLSLGFLDFLLAIHVARRDINTVRQFAVAFVVTETTTFIAFFQVSGELTLSKLAANILAFTIATIVAYRALFFSPVYRFGDKIKHSFRPLLIDVYGGLFSLTLLLRAQIFPLIMYERFADELIASFGMLNQVGLLWIFVMRGYMNSHQRDLSAIYQGRVSSRGIVRLYSVYVTLFVVGLFLIFLSSIAIDVLIAGSDARQFLLPVILLFMLTSVYVAFNDFLVFEKKTKLLLLYGILSVVLFGLIFLIDFLYQDFLHGYLLEVLALSTIPVGYVVAKNAVKVFSHRATVS